MQPGPEAVLRSIAVTTARERRLLAAWREEDDGMVTEADKVQALLDAVAVLDAAGAPYALIGGVAVGIHSGVVRATVDTDLAVASAHRTAALLDAFDRAGFRRAGEHPHSVNLRHASAEPVQLAFDPWFDPMIARAESFDVRGLAVRLVRRDDLVAMKRRAAADPARRRSKALRDQADVELLLGDVPSPDEGW